jgi:hypothetical protein
MKTIRAFLIPALALVVGVILGMMFKPSPLASIEFKNLSNKHVSTVSITVGMTTYVLRDIEQNQMKSLNVFVAGEAGYDIKVKFANGDTLANWNYINAGNKISEAISDKKIVSRLLQ